MKWLLLLSLAGAVTSLPDGTVTSRPASPEGNTDRGFIEWISGLVGGSTTTTTNKPINNDPPAECPSCHCGIARTRRRIVGGYETKKLEYPWMVMLLYNGRFYCGGALINDIYVLTAAHCSVNRVERMTVRLLEHDTSNPNETRTIDRKVVGVIRHQRYNPGTYDNDIALFKLDKRLDFTNVIKRSSRDSTEAGTEAGSESTEAETESGTEAATTTDSTETTTPAVDKDDTRLRPVCLPKQGLSYTSHCGVVTGWGVTDEGGAISNTLQEVKVPIVSNKECRDTSYGRRITDNMLCAGEPEGGHDACQGDSGGPLHVFNETTGKYYEVGVVSWGEGCARPKKYGVYSRVNRYLTWIKSNTKDACYCD